MDVILLDVLDTTGLPNLQPSCGFCKWTNGKYSICSRPKRAAFGPARFDFHFDFEWCKNRVGYRSAAEQQSGHPGKWSQMLLPSREPRILASHLLQRKFVPTSVCSKNIEKPEGNGERQHACRILENNLCPRLSMLSVGRLLVQ